MVRYGVVGFERYMEFLGWIVFVVEGVDVEVMVVLGDFVGVLLFVIVYILVVGVEVVFVLGFCVWLLLWLDWEYVLMFVEGDVVVVEYFLDCNGLLYFGDLCEEVEVLSGEGVLLFLFGGEFFEDDIVMWWNFVGCMYDEIVVVCEEWEVVFDCFGVVFGYDVCILVFLFLFVWFMFCFCKF